MLFPVLSVWYAPAAFRAYNTLKESTMAKASARHILVASSETCENLKSQIEAGADFAEIARQHSKCPSGKQGGGLGSFGPGQMVKEFDEVVFTGEIGKVLGPVKTQFGYHLIEITSRTE
jgi:peptidyl-prolyl cis-trans isomerase C